jgi:acyl carrier protein
MFLANGFTSDVQMKQFRKCSTFAELLVQFDIVDLNATLNENGVDSLKLTRLIEETKIQFDMALDFEAAQKIRCRELEAYCRGNGESRYAPRHPLPEMIPTGKRVKYLIATQLFGVFLVVAVFIASTIPSAYLYNYLTSIDCIRQNPSFVDPWLIMFKTGTG